MFCEKCGKQLSDTASFCDNCGASVNTTKNTAKNIQDTDILLRVKPNFKFSYMILPSYICWGVIILILGLMLGIGSMEAGLSIIILGFIILSLILGIKAIIKKKQYNNYYYDFYKTKVIFRDSFLNLSEKEVKYKYIREITMNQTFIQRFFNLGNIILFTNAETGFGNGIFIINVENSQEVYKKIKTLIEV